MDQISPLRDMADRVGREVDHFAETLDRFNTRLHDDDAFNAAHELAIEYKAFANNLAQKLKKRHDAQRLHELKNEFGKRLPQSPAFGSVRGSTSLAKTSYSADDGDLPENSSLDTLKQWQAEADTWELFRIMLDLRHDPDHDRAQAEKQSRLAQLGLPNRYTPDAALWERFTIEDDEARERYMVLKWLQGTAAQGERDIEAIAEELEAKSGRGSGFWVNGWMETREKIKGAKRTRLISAHTAQLDIKRSDNNELLVSELDPDAPSRQRRTLEKIDAYSERSLWMTCWEMLRRGKSWAEISDWCSERNQSWRAVSLGAAQDSAHDIPLPGVSAGALWRRLCYALASKDGTDEYEAAVYGVLSGDLETVKKISRSWDDNLYAYYNSLLLTRFDQYLQNNLPTRATPSIVQKFPISDSTRTLRSSDTAKDLVAMLRDDKTTANEARQPIKMLQGSLIGDTFGQLCQNLSTAISDAPWYKSTSPNTVPVRKTAGSNSVAESSIVSNGEALRIAVHLLIVLRHVHPSLSSTSADEGVMDNIVAAYIQFLNAAGRRDLIPLYASKMSPARAQASLAQVLSDIEDVQDKASFIGIMKLYHIDEVAVLLEQSQHLVRKITRNSKQQPLRILEQTTDDIYPGQRIKLNFTSERSGAEGTADHLLAFHILNGHWDATFGTLAYVCRKLLQHGCFQEASRLVHILSFESLSATKSRPILGKAVNVMDHEETQDLHDDTEHAAILRLLQRQSQGYYELTLLIRAIDALETWRQMEHEHLSKTPQPTSAPPKLKKAFEEICNAVEPVLTGILVTAKDDAEAEDLAEIRSRFLPEIILAYNAALCAAAHLVSRDHLMSSMQLAATVADEKNGLVEPIMQAGRMREVVTSFARSSETMLKLNEMGKPRREKKHKTGGNLAIWEIGG